ncbi:MAG: TetR/AcrR family transcriptional regulator [Clostridiaceae bacterium]|jgi:AcrR family transcriptional regulator|nr:TetR/AcrR family transcriptional regulator [Clostridiaceae bacterium]
MKSKKTDRRIKYTKMVLRESFVKLLKQKPISKITIKEICEEADINRATFYSHYSDQYDLLRQIETGLLSDINEYLAGYSFSDNGSESIQILQKIFEYVQENAEVCSVMLSDKGDISFQQEVMKIVQKQCISEWTKKSVNKELAEYIYSFAVTGSVGVVHKWLKEGMKQSARELAEMVINLTNRGISAFV